MTRLSGVRRLRYGRAGGCCVALLALLGATGPGATGPATGCGPDGCTPAGGPLPAPSGSGYHHLGATTDGTWSVVLGRMAVTAPGVRAGSYDFVASRFLAKADTPAGTRWLEAGWAQTGWSGTGRQRVYTYDTNSRRWTFYDQYPIGAGDRIWIELAATPEHPERSWSAWLWWRGGWRLLAEADLPIGAHARLEQYVEVYVDPKRRGTVRVPPIRVDSVQVAAQPGAPLRYWTAPGVATSPRPATDPYCLTWASGYDDWSAGSC